MLGVSQTYSLGGEVEKYYYLTTFFSFSLSLFVYPTVSNSTTCEMQDATFDHCKA